MTARKPRPGWVRVLVPAALTLACVIAFGFLGAYDKRHVNDQSGSSAMVSLLALPLLGLFILGIVLTIRNSWQVWRGYRRRHGHFTAQERAANELAAAAAREASEGWSAAQQLGSALVAAQRPTPLTVWGVVLENDEVADYDLQLTYARYYGLDASYTHVSGAFVGSVPFVVAGGVMTAIGNQSRRAAAERAALTTWREFRLTRVLVTDRRLLIDVGGRWLSFWYSGVTAFYPEPSRWSMVLDFPDTSPLMLTGVAAPLAAVYVAERLHGRDGLLAHPALADLRGNNVYANGPLAFGPSK